MASNRMMRREKKRIRLQLLKRDQRAELRKALNDPAIIDVEEKYKLLAEFEKLPRDSGRVRQSRRCAITGRSRGVYRFVGVCRNKFRELAMRGEMPGMVKSSWG